MPFLHKRFEQIFQGRHFCAFSLAQFCVHQRGVAANLAQPQQRRQNVESLVIKLLIRFQPKNYLARAFEFRAIKRFLRPFHLTKQVLLHAVG